MCVIRCERVCEYNFRAVSYDETIQSPLITILLDTSHVMLAADVAATASSAHLLFSLHNASCC